MTLSKLEIHAVFDRCYKRQLSVFTRSMRLCQMCIRFKHLSIFRQEEYLCGVLNEERVQEQKSAKKHTHTIPLL